jgi:hypothetical protein
MNRILAVIAGLVFLASSARGQPRPAPAWGATTDGLELGVSAVASGTEGAYVVEVSFRNTGPNDALLNLGWMTGNGRVMFPDAVRVRLTEPSGTTCELHYFDRRHALIRGRVDDLVVGLPAGSAYVLRLTSDRLWCTAAVEPRTTLVPGRYRATARFEGNGAQTTNLDMPGLALMTFWKGRLDSGEASFEIGR